MPRARSNDVASPLRIAPLWYSTSRGSRWWMPPTFARTRRWPCDPRLRVPPV